MLTFLGFAMVGTFMFLIMTKRLSPVVALIAVPVVFALVGGFGGDGIGAMMLEGIRGLAPTGVMLMFAIPLPVLFMIAFAIAIVLNYPNAKEQRARVAAHSANVIAVVSLIFAAGIFTGILSGTGMVDAMSKSLLAVLPDSLGPFLAPITALLSLPFTFFISNDAFYYGVMPVLADAAQAHGISHVEMARASLIGQPVHLLSPLVPSTYLLVGLADVEFGDHQRYALKWTIGICLILMSAALLLGVFPLVA